MPDEAKSANSEVSPKFMNLQRVLTQTLAVVESAIEPALTERKEVVKHLVTLGSSGIGLVFTLRAISGGTQMPFAGGVLIRIVWIGMGCAVIFGVLSSWLSVAVKSARLEIMNKGIELDALARSGQDLDGMLQQLEVISQRIILRLSVSENISRTFLALSFFSFLVSMVLILVLGWNSVL